MQFGVLSVALSVLSFGLSFYELELIFAFAGDVERLLLSLALYKAFNMSRWRFKVISLAILTYYVFATINNSLIYLDVVESIPVSFVSLLSALLFIFLMGSRLLTKWYSLPNEKIEPCYLYEIIGKPKTDLQMLLFIATGGLGGSFAVTDGKECVYMSKDYGCAIKEPLDPEYMRGKKLVKLCMDTKENRAVLDSKVGKKFNLLRNCYWLTMGFDREGLS